MKFLDLNNAICCMRAKYQKERAKIDEMITTKMYKSEVVYKKYSPVINAQCVFIESLLTLAAQLSGSGDLPLYEYIAGADVEADVVEKTMLVIERANREMAFLDMLLNWASTSERFNSAVSF